MHEDPYNIAQRLKAKQQIAVENAKKRRELQRTLTTEVNLETMKFLAQSLLNNLKEYCLLIKSGKDDPKIVTVEKEITEISKQLYNQGQIKQHANEFIHSIKLIFITGRSLKTNPSDLQNISNKISEDLKNCAQKIKVLLDPRQATTPIKRTSGSGVYDSFNRSQTLSPNNTDKLTNPSRYFRSSTSGNPSPKEVDTNNFSNSTSSLDINRKQKR